MEDIIPEIVYWCGGKATVRLLLASKSVYACVSETDLVKAKIRRLLLESGSYDDALMWYVKSKRPCIKVVKQVVIHASEKCLNKSLRIVCERGSVDLCKTILDWRSDLDLDDALLHCRYSNLDIANLLVKAGADVQTHNNSILLHACHRNDIEWYKFCTENGADVRAHNDEVLYWAVGRNHLKLCTMLLDDGADLNSRNFLSLAAMSGLSDMCRLLITRGADVHQNNDDALRYALFLKYSYICCILLEAGADIQVVYDYPDVGMKNRVLREWENSKRQNRALL